MSCKEGGELLATALSGLSGCGVEDLLQEVACGLES